MSVRADQNIPKQRRRYEIVPARDHAAVTPSDTTVLDNPPFRSLYVGTAGDVVVTSLAGNDATYKNVANGTTLNVMGTKVKAATTASNIVALF